RAVAHFQQHAVKVVVDETDQKKRALRIEERENPFEQKQHLVETVAADAEIERVDPRQSFDLGRQGIDGARGGFDEGIANKLQLDAAWRIVMRAAAADARSLVAWSANIRIADVS